MAQSSGLDETAFPSVEDAQVELFFNPTAEGYTRLGFAYQNHDLKLHQAGKFQTLALDSYCRALALNPESNLRVLIYHNLGILHYMMGNLNKAVLSQEKADRLSVSNLQKIRGSILYEKGMALKALSRFEEALEAFRQCIAFDNLFGHAYLGAANCLISMSSQTSLMEQLYRDMRRVDKKIDVAPRRAALLQGMFEVLHRLDRESEAFEALMRSRDILKVASGGSISSGDQQSPAAREAIARTTSIMTIFQPGFWPRNVGHPSRFPIFIVGMMRSGSTLLEQILHTHSRILGLGEDSVFNANLRSAKDQIVQLSMQDSTNAKAMAELVHFHAEYMISLMKEKLPEKFKSTAHSNFDPFPKSEDSSIDDQPDAAFDCKMSDADDDNLCLRMEERKDDDHHIAPILHIVDKMLFNYRNIGLIRLIFPNALVINMVRDPMDTLWSCLRHKFEDSGLEFTYDIKDLVTEFVTYLEIMAHWRTVLPGFVTDLHYEHLVDNPQAVVEPILTNKLGLSWEESMNRFYESDRSVITHSTNQVRQPLYRTSIGAWKTYRQQLQPLIDVLTPFIRQIKGRSGLPFVNDLNWDLSADYSYSSNPSSNVSSAAVTTSSPITNVEKKKKKV